MPTPIKIVSRSCAHPGMSSVSSKKYGVRKSANIEIVLRCKLQFPVFLILFSLKYSLTRLLSVLKKLAGSFLENRMCRVFMYACIYSFYFFSISCKVDKDIDFCFYWFTYVVKLTILIFVL